MSLPDWDERGVLPAGIHTGTMPEVYERCVEGMPHREKREVLYSTLMSYFAEIQKMIPHGRLWIDGGFVMKKDAPPKDVDIVVIPDDWVAMFDGEEFQARFPTFITLQNVFAEVPELVLDRLQPYGGLVDTFLSRPDETSYWQYMWSRVKLNGEIYEDQEKGFVEVTW